MSEEESASRDDDSSTETDFVSVRCALRRRSSFSKLSSLVSDINEWFFHDESLANVIRTFFREKASTITDGVRVFEVMPKDIEESNSLGVTAHQRKIIHSQFESLFEDQLLAYLTRMRLDQEQLQAVYQISLEEEAVEGNHFYRWSDCTDYSVFLRVIHKACNTPCCDPMEELRTIITERSLEAKTTFERLKDIRQYVDLWENEEVSATSAQEAQPAAHPITFKAFLAILQKEDFPQPNFDRATKKDMLRWSHSICQPKLNEATGIYDNTEATKRGHGVFPDRGEWERYVVKWCSTFDKDTFDLFVRSLQQKFNTLHSSPPQRVRRCIWRIGEVLDPHRTGNVDYRLVAPELRHVLTTMAEGPARHGRKILSKWMTKTKGATEGPHPMNITQLHDMICEFWGFEGGSYLEASVKNLEEVTDNIESVHA